MSAFQDHHKAQVSGGNPKQSESTDSSEYYNPYLNNAHPNIPMPPRPKDRSIWVYALILALILSNLYLGYLIWNSSKSMINTNAPDHSWTRTVIRAFFEKPLAPGTQRSLRLRYGNCPSQGSKGRAIIMH